jgi:gluconokinase
MSALLEGIGYNLKWTLDNIQRDYGIIVNELTVIGGGSQNAAWMQSLSDILQVKLNITKNPKTGGAIGSAMTAFVGLGLEKDFSRIKEFNPITKSFTPRQDHQVVYNEMFEDYKVLYYSLKKTYQSINYKRFSKN